MVVKRSGAHQITLLTLNDLLGDMAKILISRDQTVRVKVFSLVGYRLRIGGLLQSLNLIADLDGFAAVLRTKFEEKDFVAVFPLLQYALLPRSVYGLNLDCLKRVGGRQGKPHAGDTDYLGNCDPVEKFELVAISDNAQVAF
ncbi:MAG: hypothetical protein ACYC6G_16715 [Desulfobaccales bacterium]